MNEGVLLKLKLYKKRKKKWYDERNQLRNLLLIILLIPCVALIFDNSNNIVLGFIILILLILWIILLVGKFGINYISEEIDNHLFICKNKLVIGKRSILIEEIKNIDMILNDFYMKNEFRSTSDYTPLHSQGFKNFIYLETKVEEKVEVQFQLRNDVEKLMFSEFIYSLIQSELITRKQGVAFLSLSNKKQINEYYEVLNQRGIGSTD